MTIFRSSGPVNELSEHWHNNQRVFGLRDPQTATLWADPATLLPYTVTSGNDTWGTAIQVIGTGDLPLQDNKLTFDAGKLYVDGAGEDSPYRIRLIYGPDNSGDAIARGDYTESIFKFDSLAPTFTAANPVFILMPILRSGVIKVWAQTWNATDAATLNFFVEFHEY
jgi:hypothetical protein